MANLKKPLRDPGESIFTEIHNAAKDAGLKITEVCRSSGVPLATFYYWRDNEPPVIKHVREMKKYIEQYNKLSPEQKQQLKNAKTKVLPAGGETAN